MSTMADGIERLHELPVDALGALVVESAQAGSMFVSRLVDEWVSGANRFNQQTRRGVVPAARDGEPRFEAATATAFRASPCTDSHCPACSSCCSSAHPAPSGGAAGRRCHPSACSP